MWRNYIASSERRDQGLLYFHVMRFHGTRVSAVIKFTPGRRTTLPAPILTQFTNGQQNSMQVASTEFHRNRQKKKKYIEGT